MQRRETRDLIDPDRQTIGLGETVLGTRHFVPSRLGTSVNIELNVQGASSYPIGHHLMIAKGRRESWRQPLGACEVPGGLIHAFRS